MGLAAGWLGTDCTAPLPLCSLTAALLQSPLLDPAQVSATKRLSVARESRRLRSLLRASRRQRTINAFGGKGKAHHTTSHRQQQSKGSSITPALTRRAGLLQMHVHRMATIGAHQLVDSGAAPTEQQATTPGAGHRPNLRSTSYSREKPPQICNCLHQSCLQVLASWARPCSPSHPM